MLDAEAPGMAVGGKSGTRSWLRSYSLHLRSRFHEALSEQVVLITGASRGLGAAIAQAFGREGARVVVNYFQSEDAAHAVADAIGSDHALAVPADAREKTQVEAMVEHATDHFGAAVDVVVSNALVGGYEFDAAARAGADAIAWTDYEAQLRGSVGATLHAVQACLPGMKQQGFGRVIGIGSNLVQNPVVAYHDYTAAKAAQLGLVRTMASDLGPHGITVNMVSAGLLRTTDASAATSEEVFGIIEQTTPRRQVTTPGEVADAVLFFASPWSRAVTGQNLVVDGGLVMN